MMGEGGAGQSPSSAPLGLPRVHRPRAVGVHSPCEQNWAQASFPSTGR